MGFCLNIQQFDKICQNGRQRSVIFWSFAAENAGISAVVDACELARLLIIKPTPDPIRHGQ